MSREPSDYSSLPLLQLQEIANDFEPVNAHDPKFWFEKARYEAEKAILAERFKRPEELFVAYVRACQCYSNVKAHAAFVTVKKKDPAWAERVSDFRTTYEGFLGKAKTLKETLKTRELEKHGNGNGKDSLSPMGNGNGATSTTRPSATRQPSGPDAGSLGSIQDRLRMLQSKGINVGDTNKRGSRDLSTAAAGKGKPPSVTNNPTRPRASSGAKPPGQASNRPQETQPEDIKAIEKELVKKETTGSSIAPSSASAQPTSPHPPSAQLTSPTGTPLGGDSQSIRPTTTGSSTKTRHSIDVHPSSSGPSRRPTVSSPSVSPNHSGNQQSSKPPLPSIPQSQEQSSSSATRPHPKSPLPQPPQLPSPPQPEIEHRAASTENLHDFEKAFPSLSEFSKQYEEPPGDGFAFERDPDSNKEISGLPNVKPAHSGTGEKKDTKTDLDQDNRLPELKLPDVNGLPDLPSLPSVPSSRPGLPVPPAKPDELKGEALGPPSPDMSADIKRAASTPNVVAMTQSSPEAERSPLPQPVKSPLGPRPGPSTPGPNGVASPPPSVSSAPTHRLSFPVAQPTPGPSKEAVAVKPKFPFTNSVDCDTLRSYFLNPAVDVLLLDVRPEDEFQQGYVGVQYESRGAKINIVWLDPTVVMRDGMTSQKLEDALSLSSESQRKAFDRRNKFDLVVVYDSHSLNWPRKGDEPGKAPPLARLWEIIYEHEFGKRLERTPVLLTGGYTGWVEFIKSRAAKHAQEYAKAQAQAQANGYGRNGIPNGHPPPPTPPRDPGQRERSGSATDPTKRANRDTPVYQSSQYAKSIADSFGYATQSMTGESSYTGRQRAYVSSPPPLPSRGHHSPSPSLSSYNATTPIAPPPQASIHPGPGNRRRSDYVEHHNQSYSGYQSPSNRPSIDYPQAHSLAQVPQPPPPTQSHVSERYDTRPSVVRSGSIRGLDLMANGDEVRYWNDVVLGLTGLKNLGNTCYMNSTIQCLSATYPFTSYFLDGSFRRSINVNNPLGMKGRLAMAFAELLKALWKEDYTFLSPVTFRKQIIGFANQFQGTDQHDSQEFLSFVLDGLHEDLNRIKQKPPPVEMTPEREAALETLPPEVASEKEWQIYRMRNDSFIVDLFQGQYRNRLECLTCHKTSTTYDTFMYLSLPVPAGKSKVVVQELIDEFVKVELLDGEDAWNCPRCKAPRRASKTLTISRLPPVLLIHLKRFTTQNGVFWDKSETPVIFPVKGLDLTRFVPHRQPTGHEDLEDPRTQVGPFRYDLYGVSNHMGTLSSGHYTAYVKSSKGWQYCEDSRVTKAHEKDVVSRPAYILFYKRIR